MRERTEWWPDADDQVADALRYIRRQHDLERANGMVLRVLLAMMAASWIAVVARWVWQLLAGR